jgi:hypothetical protein
MGFAILLSIIFVVIYIIGLYKGSIFVDKVREMKMVSEEYLFDEMSDKEFEKKILGAFFPIFIGGLILFITEVSFLLAMINEKGMLLPTAAMLALIVVSFANGMMKSKKTKQSKGGTTEAFRELAKKAMKMKERTTKGMIIKFLCLVYYSYVLLVLLGL